MDLMLDASRKRHLVEELRHRLEEGVDLPVLPEVAHELLLLRNRSEVESGTLVGIIAKDPVISAQMLSYARMSGFGYGERIKTLDDAISLVMGQDKAIHMALGLSAGRSMPVELDGPLGLRAFWQNSLNCALLTQALAKELPSEYKANPGLSYLAGLFHDMGFLVFGSLYPDEFSTLNRLVSSYEWIETRELEFHCIGISHDMIGSYLMRAWNMPEEIVLAVGEHHFPDFDGQHAIYPKLVYLADLLMRMRNQSLLLDEPWAKFEKIGLDEAAVQRATKHVEMILPELEHMAEELLQA